LNPEQASEVSSSGVWQNVCEELDLWIKNEMEKLKSCPLDQVANIQQAIRNYERVKQLPQIVKDKE